MFIDYKKVATANESHVGRYHKDFRPGAVAWSTVKIFLLSNLVAVGHIMWAYVLKICGRRGLAPWNRGVADP